MQAAALLWWLLPTGLLASGTADPASRWSADAELWGVALQVEDGCQWQGTSAEGCVPQALSLIQKSAALVPGVRADVAHEEAVDRFLAPRWNELDVGDHQATRTAADGDWLVGLLRGRGHSNHSYFPFWDTLRKDVFPMAEDSATQNPQNQFVINMAPLDEWMILVGTVAVCSILEFYGIRRLFGGGGRGNVACMLFWILAGIGYNVYFFARYGEEAALQWCTGFVLEWMLSVDNLFVFILIFKVYRTPKELMPKALFFGIVGGILCRIFIFLALGTLLQVIHWIRIVFGVILIYSGIQAISDDEGDEDISKTYGVRCIRWLLGSRLVESYDMRGRLFVTGPDGRTCITLTVYVILCLEITDMLFAVDSVSAKVTQLPNQYIAYSSSVVAVFGLRAMFFVIKDLIDYFELLKYGLCIVLVFVGVELVMSPFLHLETGTVCIVILSVFLVSLTASTAKRMLAPTQTKAPPSTTAEYVGDARKHEAG